jgi:hypothetical protein
LFVDSTLHSHPAIFTRSDEGHIESAEFGQPDKRQIVSRMRDKVMKSVFETRMKSAAAILLTICGIAPAIVVRGDDPPKPPSATEPANRTKHQITGLFSTDREQDLRDVVAKLPEFKLAGIDFANAEAVFEYDPAKSFPGAKPEQIVERFDNLLRGASNHTFGVKPLRTVDRDKLKLVEIPVVGLDCKACSLGAYDAVYRLKGVECATASFKEGRVTALIHPDLTDRTELETALKQRGVQIKTP